MYELLSFNYDDKQINAFKEYAIKLYSDDIYWTKIDESYPDEYVTKFFLVKDKDITIGRACAIINPGITYKNKKTGLIGFFECNDNYNACRLLFDGIIEYYKTLDINYIIGPLNGSTWKSYRLTELSDNPPFFLDNYHKPWYSQQFKDYGFDVIAQYSSTKIEVGKRNIKKRVTKFKDHFEQKGIKIRAISQAFFEDDLKKIYDICIESFKNNFLYTDISYRKFYQMYNDLKFFMDPELSLIAEDEDGTPCGFIFTMDNMFDQDKKSLVIKSVGTLQSPKYRGIGTFLVEKIHSDTVKKHYDYVIHALMYEDNVSSNVLSNYSELYHRYSLYGKDI